MKKIVSVVLVVLTAFSISLSAFAAEVSAEFYDTTGITIEEVTIDIDVEKNGVVKVDEFWTIKYSSQNIFYRHISNDDTISALQKFESVENLSIKVGDDVIAQNSEKNEAYDFYQEESGNYVVAVTYPTSSPASVDSEAGFSVFNYTISYELTGAVKKNEDNADFAYMVLGTAFLYTSNNVTINVTFPDGATNIIALDNPKCEINNTTAKYFKATVGNIFEVHVTSDKDVFDADSLASHSKAKQFFNDLAAGIKDSLVYIAVVIAVATVILLVLMYDKLLRFGVEKKAKKLLKSENAQQANEDVALEKEDAFQFLPDGMSACEAYKMLVPTSRFSPKKSSKKVHLLFAMAVLECVEKGYVVKRENDFIVGTPPKSESAYIQSVINFLKTFSDTQDKQYSINESFAKKVAQECSSEPNVMTNYLATFYDLIPNVNSRFFTNKNHIDNHNYINAYIVKEKATALVAENKLDFSAYFEKVLSSSKTTDVQVFAMLCDEEGMMFENGKDSIGVLNEAFSQMYRCFNKIK